MSRLVLCLGIAASLVAALGEAPARGAAPPRPNVLILYADDLGYADLGITGNKQCPTPHLDSLARHGVRFANSYVTGCVCSPSRAGLLTGRYQQRFGFDANAEGGSKLVVGDVKGLDLKQRTFADHFKALGYATGLVGKWHVGSDKPEYLPNARGFDSFYGLLPHGIGAGKKGEPVPMWRNAEPAPVPEDHTLAFGEEARQFIQRHRGGPWFLYCAFTAVHAPFVSPQSYLDRFADVQPPARGKYLAMVALLDDVVGSILGKLRSLGLEENTLIFFASDNGGPGGAADNGVFRGSKWTLWEGGIRSPILIQWKGRIPGGRQLPLPTTQLDWLPTALAAAGAEIKPQWKLDGANLLPVLEGTSDGPAARPLFWRFGVQYAVRDGDWKLVKPALDDAPKLFNLADDPGESKDLATERPEQLRRLQALWDGWNAGNEPPRWIDDRWNGRGPKGEKPAAKGARKGAKAAAKRPAASP